MEISGQMEMVAESPALTAPELLHDCVSLLLWHVSVHGANGEVGLPHLLRQPVHLPLGVAEDHRLQCMPGQQQIWTCNSASKRYK